MQPCHAVYKLRHNQDRLLKISLDACRHDIKVDLSLDTFEIHLVLLLSPLVLLVSHPVALPFKEETRALQNELLGSSLSSYHSHVILVKTKLADTHTVAVDCHKATHIENKR